jgi:hypothetical protein
VFDLLEMKADKKKLHLHSKTIISCQISWGLIKIVYSKVIENLIVNSIKYGKNEWYHWSGGG